MIFRLVLLLLLAAAPARAADFVWWEGEKPARTNFPTNSPFAPAGSFANRRDQLSAGDWLSAGGKRGPEVLFAKYQIAIPQPGDFAFWTRKFWHHGPFRWRFDNQPWQTCDRNVGLADSTPLAKYIEANWVSLGRVTLTAGPHAFELELLAKQGEETACAFDCFLLTTGPFIPDGKLKPGERSGRHDPGYFPFEPPPDPFTAESAFDLRALNESSAGVHGPLRHAGDRFALGDGAPVRFWAVDVSGNNAAQDHGSVDYLARKLAKLGVNMVRFHSPLYAGDDPTRIDPKALDDFQYLVAAMKRQGIYTYLSFYYPLWIHADNPRLLLPGFDKLGNKNPFSLLYFDPRMQAIHRGWARQILTAPNPYTTLPLARDPAVAIVEVVNEDSMFFWTFNRKSIPPQQWDELREQFTRWAVKRYRSLDNAKAAWGGSLSDDTADRLALVEAWGMTHDGAQHFGAKRIADQVRFLAEVQRGWYAETARYLREDLHYAGLVNASNWFTTDPAALGGVDRWTYTAGDVTDQHGYFEATVTGEATGYAVRVGDQFADRPSVLAPADVPLRTVRTAGFPQIISELGWTNPNGDRADAVFLSAAYGSLQGIDGLYFFAVGNNYLRDTTLSKFGVSTPIIAGAFPAAALSYRRGDVTTGEPVANEFVDPRAFAAHPEVDALAPFVGPAVRTFGPGTSTQRDLSASINRSTEVIRSETNQLRWDYGTGVVRMDTPRAQGVAGLLGQAGATDLGDVRITCRNAFAAVTVVSLDGLPLKSSKRMLAQTITREQPFGFKVAPASSGRQKITDLGGTPDGVEDVACTLSLHGGPATLTALDENGYPHGPAKVVTDAFELSPHAIYHLLTRP